MRAFRSVFMQCLAVLILGLAVCSPLWSQQDFSKGAPIFPNVLKPYQPRHVPPADFTNSKRLDDLIKDGKLNLSLDDAIALTLENNLDLVIARYNLPIADTDILRTKSGAAVRGVNTGIISGIPGGGAGTVGNTGSQGGGAGGTQAAAGGAGAGTSGLVESTLGVGPTLDSYDPIFSTSLGIQHANTPQSNTIFSGVPSLMQNTATANFSYVQGFTSGTQLAVTYDNSRVTTNSTRTELVPQLNSNYLIQVRQHLLQGFGFPSTRRYMIIARNNREIADISFRQQVIYSVTQMETLYWNLVAAYESVTAAQHSLELAKQLEANNRAQVKVGTLAPIEIVNAQAQVATANQALIAAQTNLQLQQTLMKNAISRNQNDPLLTAAVVIPTDRMQIPASEPVEPIQDLIAEALQNRPELAVSRIDLSNRKLSVTTARNAMLPALDLVANYGGTGLAGNFNPFFQNLGGGATGVVSNTGFGDATTAMGSHPTYFVGFNVNIPIRNRAAQADQIRSELEYRQAEVRIKEVENQIAIDVKNAQFTVQQDRAQVEAAINAREYAAQSLDAEQKKLAQGLSTTYNVTQMLTNLATAESNLVTAMTAYEDARVLLDVVTGRTLEHLGITMDEGETGKVTQLPHVPGVVPSSEAIAHPIAPSAGAPAQTPAPAPQVPQQQQQPQPQQPPQ